MKYLSALALSIAILSSFVLLIQTVDRVDVDIDSKHPAREIDERQNSQTPIKQTQAQRNLTFYDRLAQAAIERTRHSVVYDPKYVKIAYPGGDVPSGTGVCTDVVVRSYRALGAYGTNAIDLQKEVHEDMSRNFDSYPQNWGLHGPDKNIDHRRVPNLMTFFRRMDAELSVTDKPSDYLPGDIVSWDLGRGITHIGIVVEQQSRDNKRNMIVHNIGSGPKMEDVLFDYTITGHYRYGGE